MTEVPIILKLQFLYDRYLRHESVNSMPVTFQIKNKDKRKTLKSHPQHSKRFGKDFCNPFQQKSNKLLFCINSYFHSISKR